MDDTKYTPSLGGLCSWLCFANIPVTGIKYIVFSTDNKVVGRQLVIKIIWLCGWLTFLQVVHIFFATWTLVWIVLFMYSVLHTRASYTVGCNVSCQQSDIFSSEADQICKSKTKGTLSCSTQSLYYHVAYIVSIDQWKSLTWGKNSPYEGSNLMLCLYV